MPAPVASGWSGRRVGLAPTGKAPPFHGAHGSRTLRRRGSLRYKYPLQAAIGSIRLGSLFLTFPTLVLTGQHVISSDGNGASRALSADASAGSSPSQTGHASGFRTTGMRL